MKKVIYATIILFGVFIFISPRGYCQIQSSKEGLSKTLDTNKDGKADVWFYSKDKQIRRVELDSNKDQKPDIVHVISPYGRETIQADTNHDGKYDVLVTAKNGKFQSAEVDTNKDGKVDKSFNNTKDFTAWVNNNEPGLKKGLDNLKMSEQGVGITLFKF